MKIGITGGIGSGKTIITKIFRVLGIPVFYADEEAKKIMQNDKSLVAAIKANFGSETYDEEGCINRTYLASRVFNDKVALEKLNSLVHPATIQSAEIWAAKQQAPYSLKEAALLFESGSYRLNDLNILVICPIELRINRIMRREGMNEDSVRTRMSKQWLDEEKQPLADFIIINDEVSAVIPQVLHIHKTIIDQLAV